MAKEKVTLRKIIKGMERTMERAAQYSTLDSLVLSDLKQLEERIEGMPQKIREKYPLNSFVGIGWACEEILGKEESDG